MGLYDALMNGGQEQFEDNTAMGKVACLEDVANLIDEGFGIGEIANILHAQVSDVDELNKQASDWSPEDAAGYRAQAYELLGACEETIANFEIAEGLENEAAFAAFEKVAKKSGVMAQLKKDFKGARKDVADNFNAGGQRGYKELFNNGRGLVGRAKSTLRDAGKLGLQTAGRVWTGGKDATALRRLAPKVGLGVAGAGALAGGALLARNKMRERDEQNGRKRASYEPTANEIETAYQILDAAGHIQE